MSARVRLGELLVDAQIISREELQQVLDLQADDGRRLGTLLVESGLVTETQVTQILSQQLSVPWVSLYHIDFSRQLLNLVPRDVAERHCLVPIFVRRVRGVGDTLYVAMDDPSDESAQAAVSQYAGLPTRAMIAPPSDIKSAIRVYYGARSDASDLSTAQQEMGDDAPEGGDSLPDDAHDAPEVSVQAVPSSQAPEVELTDDALESVPVVPDDVPPDAGNIPKAGAVPAEAAALADGGDGEDADAAAAAPSTDEPGQGAEIAAAGAPVPARQSVMPKPKKGRTARMVTLTLLDGTEVVLPTRDKKRRRAGDVAPSEMTARDMVVALRAIAQGADSAELFGEPVRWEAMFAALLDLFLKKHLIADWEFVEELRRHQGGGDTAAAPASDDGAAPAADGAADDAADGAADDGTVGAGA